MKTDQNRAKLRGKVMPQPTPMVDPMFPEHDWEATDLVSTSRIRTEQQAIKEGVNDPSMQETVGARPQDAGKTADSPAYQPTNAKVCSDMVTGDEMSAYPAPVPVKASGDLAAGGFSGGQDHTPSVRGL